MKKIKFTAGNATILTFERNAENWYIANNFTPLVKFANKLRFNNCYSKVINAPFCLELPEYTEQKTLKILTGLRPIAHNSETRFIGNKFERILQGKKVLSTLLVFFTPDSQQMKIYYFEKMDLQGNLLNVTINEVCKVEL